MKIDDILCKSYVTQKMESYKCVESINHKINKNNGHHIFELYVNEKNDDIKTKLNNDFVNNEIYNGNIYEEKTNKNITYYKVEIKYLAD